MYVLATNAGVSNAFFVWQQHSGFEVSRTVEEAGRLLKECDENNWMLLSVRSSNIKESSPVNVLLFIRMMLLEARVS